MGILDFLAGTGGALFSFLGGSAFRMLWGEVSAYLNKKQDHRYELERMHVQGTLDAAQHGRNMEAIRIQAELQVKVIEVAAQGEVDKTLASAWASVVDSTTRLTGIWVVDLWNAIIRPGGATWAIAMLTVNEVGAFASPMSADTRMVCFAFIGLFVADRTLGKRGK